MSFLFMLPALAVWPELYEAAKDVQSSNDWSVYTLPMLMLFIVMWFVVNVAAGRLTVFITKNRSHVWVVVALLDFYAAYMHLYQLWNNLANWYNVVIVVMFPPPLFLGSLLVKAGGAVSAEEPNTASWRHRTRLFQWPFYSASEG